MKPEHIQALKRGREEGNAVRAYLEALDAARGTDSVSPDPTARTSSGRTRPREDMYRRLDRIESEVIDAESVKRLRLLQERRDLLGEVDDIDYPRAAAELEAGFLKVARSYGESLGIDYETWREFGVPPAVLKRAGIPRGGGMDAGSA